jgi:hypothetical protein
MRNHDEQNRNCPQPGISPDFRCDNYRLPRPYSGGLGVTIFFFLSGFLITTLMLREAGEKGNISIRNFQPELSLADKDCHRAGASGQILSLAASRFSAINSP